jgi:hypothetical protein
MDTDETAATTNVGLQCGLWRASKNIPGGRQKDHRLVPRHGSGG